VRVLEAQLVEARRETDVARQEADVSRQEADMARREAEEARQAAHMEVEAQVEAAQLTEAKV
jgi:hypothetical protein